MWDQLITSIKNNDTQSAMELISKMSVEELITTDRGQNTALHYAAQRGLVKICSLLLDKAPGLIKIKNYNGGTAMHSAAINGSTETCLLFMGKAPIMVNTKDSMGNTILHHAAMGGARRQMFTKHLILMGIRNIYFEGKDNDSSNAVKEETVSIAETEQLLAGQIYPSHTDSI